MAVPVTERGYVSADSGPWSVLDDAEETPELRWPQSIEVYDQMRRQESQIISVLRAVTLPIRRTSWWIDPAGARDEVAARIGQDLGLPLVGEEAVPGRSKDRFSWPDHLRMALLMLPFGHSFFEQTYRIENGLAHLHKLGWRPPRTISRIDVASDGGLVAIHQHATVERKDPRIPVSQLVAYVHDREGGNWLGQSLLRGAYRPWLLKDRALRTQDISLRRNGLGVPKYTGSELPDTIVGKERQELEQRELDTGLVLATKYRSGENAGAAIPHGAQLSFDGVTGRLPDTNGPIRYHDEQIARAVLAHFLNLGTETGSWALGTTFADFFVLSLQTVALQIQDITNAHVIEDLVEINWGPDEQPPRLVFDEIGSRHQATAEAIKMLIECGAITRDAVLEQHLRNKYGLPMADPDTARPTPGPTQPTGPGQPVEPGGQRTLAAVPGGAR